jgi:hypothetical protein
VAHGLRCVRREAAVEVISHAAALLDVIKRVRGVAQKNAAIAGEPAARSLCCTILVLTTISRSRPLGQGTDQWRHHAGTRAAEN